jgi:hypothetical protein
MCAVVEQEEKWWRVRGSMEPCQRIDRIHFICHGRQTTTLKQEHGAPVVGRARLAISVP